MAPARGLTMEDLCDSWPVTSMEKAVGAMHGVVPGGAQPAHVGWRAHVHRGTLRFTRVAFPPGAAVGGY